MTSEIKYHDYLFLSDTTPSKFKLAGECPDKGTIEGRELKNKKLQNGKWIGILLARSQEIHAKGSSAASFIYELSTTMLRSFRRSLSEELFDDHQPHT